MATQDPNGAFTLYTNDGSYSTDFGENFQGDSHRFDHGNPPINFEATGYIQGSGSADTVSMKIRGGNHTDSCSECGCCYIPQPPTNGGTFQYQVECPHPNNHDCTPDFAGNCSGISGGSWRGYKAIAWNTQANCVHWEAWEDKGSNLANQWQRVGYHTDCTGSCGNIGSPLLRPKGSSSQMTFRIDGNNASGQWFSIVQLIPGNSTAPPSGGTTPPPTQPGTGGSGPGTPGTGGSGPGTIPGGGNTGEPSPQPGTNPNYGGGGGGNDFTTGTGGAQAFASGGCAIATAGGRTVTAGDCSGGGTAGPGTTPGDGGLGGTIEPKPIVTVYKDLALLYNIRVDLFDNCTISGDANITSFDEIYNVQGTEGQYITLFQNSTTAFVGTKLHSLKSALYHKKIRKVTVSMKRSTGVALTGNLVMEIRDRNGNVMHEFDTVIDPATVGLNDDQYDFESLENDYKLEVGDMIVLSYADGGDSTNHILVQSAPGADSFDGFNTVYVESQSGLSYEVDQLQDFVASMFV